MTIRHLAAGLATAVLMASSASAQLIEDYRFKGSTTNSKGEPLAGVKISFYNQATGKRIVFKSDDDGEFDRRLIPHAVYDVTFTKDGYYTQNEVFDWSATSGGTITKEATIVLESEAERAEREKARAEAELGAKKGGLYQDAYEALTKNDCKKAIKKSDELLELGAGSFEYAARFIRARCLRIAGDIDTAIVEYTKAAELKPDLFEAQFDLASSLASKERYDEALERYAVAGKLHPDDALIQYEMGAILFNKGDHPGSKPYLEHAIELDPSHAAAHMALGFVYLYVEDKDFAAAKRVFSRYLELEPNSPQAEQIKAIVAGIQ